MTFDPSRWSDPLAWALAVFALGYLLGSIPFGLVITKLAGLGDIRSIGSGNIGTTNVLRTGRKDLAAATLLCDALKGAAAVLIADRIGGPHMVVAAGFGAFLGHLFPIWLRFKGGKGVATYLGLLAALAWPAALVFAGVWIATAFVTRYSSLSALAASFAVPLMLALTNDRKGALFFAILSLFLWAKHHANIRRLIAGTESRIGVKS